MILCTGDWLDIGFKQNFVIWSLEAKVFQNFVFNFDLISKVILIKQSLTYTKNLIWSFIFFSFEYTQSLPLILLHRELWLQVRWSSSTTLLPHEPSHLKSLTSRPTWPCHLASSLFIHLYSHFLHHSLSLFLN